MNGHAPEKNFISQTLSNTYWLRKQINRTTNTEPWITPILVFTNAYVETGTIKGIKIVNKKFLVPILKDGKPTPELWNNRNTIAQSLRQMHGCDYHRLRQHLNFRQKSVEPAIVAAGCAVNS